MTLRTAISRALARSLALIRREARAAVRAAPTACPRCGTQMEVHPDGGAGAWCPKCDGRDDKGRG